MSPTAFVIYKIQVLVVFQQKCWPVQLKRGSQYYFVFYYIRFSFNKNISDYEVTVFYPGAILLTLVPRLMDFRQNVRNKWPETK